MSGCNFKVTTDCFRSNSGNHANSMKIPRKLMGFCVDRYSHGLHNDYYRMMLFYGPIWHITKFDYDTAKFVVMPSCFHWFIANTTIVAVQMMIVISLGTCSVLFNSILKSYENAPELIDAFYMCLPTNKPSREQCGHIWALCCLDVSTFTADHRRTIGVLHRCLQLQEAIKQAMWAYLCNVLLRCEHVYCGSQKNNWFTTYSGPQVSSHQQAI